MEVKNQEALKENLSLLLWDRHLEVDAALSVFMSDNLSKQEQKLKQALIIKIMNALSWYQLLDLFDSETIKSEFLKPEIINGLFPRSLRKKYEFVSTIL